MKKLKYAWGTRPGRSCFRKNWRNIKNITVEIKQQYELNNIGDTTSKKINESENTFEETTNVKRQRKIEIWRVCHDKWLIVWESRTCLFTSSIST